ncbi:MAG: hypothetical protein NVS2B7_00870 [Herpetosiphon sp.]
MEPEPAARLNSLRATREELWPCLDDILDTLGPNAWLRQHGPAWTFADVPYHLAYFDHDVATWITTKPAADQPLGMQSMAEANA